MAVLPLTLTQAGYAALVNADATGFNQVRIAEIGLTATAFSPSPALTALPGQIKRVSTVAGLPASDTMLNIVFRDDNADSYQLRGFGLFLDTGVLFAVFSAGAVIVEKSALASILVTIDVALSDPIADLITFGDASWVNPAATTTVKGVVELATHAEAAAGQDDQRAVTPRGVQAIMDVRKVWGRGLATGGGDLWLDPEITVTESSEQQALAGTDFTTVMTPRRVAQALAQAIANLVGGAPAALDTLNELAAALSDDADFAASMTNALALKADKARTISGGGLVTGGGDFSANRTLTVTEATAAEAQALSAGDKVLTPRRLGDVTATAARAGIVELATPTEAWEGVDEARAVTPKALKDVLDTREGSVDRRGLVELATSAEAITGTDEVRVVTPKGLADVLQDRAATTSRTGLVELATSAEAVSGADQARAVTPKALADTFEDRLKPGVIEIYAGSAAPAGYLECNGTSVSRITYARLFAVIGTRFGAGNGSTSFTLPDLRGEFIRGWDNGRGVDSGRELGSNQADMIGSHSHSLPVRTNQGAGNGYIEDADSSDTARSTSTGDTGGSETRPRNVAMMFIIKT